MKLNKKFLACFTAMTMVMAPMSALAEDTHSITGDGSVEYLETEIYNLVLPTDECINFKVDPYGTLASTTQGDNLANVVSNASGTVTSSATAIINKSSVDLDVKIDLLFAQDANTSSNSAVKLATNKALAESGEADLYLTVDQLKDAELTTYAAAGVTTVSIQATDTKTVTASATTLTPNALVLSNSAVSIEAVAVVTVTDSSLTADEVSDKALNITLKGVPYAYFVSGKSATLSEGAIKYNSDNVYAFKIGGYAYPQAEVWKNIADAQKAGNDTAKLELTMKFTIAKSEGEPQYTTAYTFGYSGGVFVAKEAFSGNTSPNPGFDGTTIISATVNGGSTTPTITDGYVRFDLSTMTNAIGSNEIIFTCSDGNIYKAIY